MDEFEKNNQPETELNSDTDYNNQAATSENCEEPLAQNREDFDPTAVEKEIPDSVAEESSDIPEEAYTAEYTPDESDIFETSAPTDNDTVNFENTAPTDNDTVNFENKAPYTGNTLFETRPEKVKSRGLRVFCIILAFVLVAAFSATAGYMVSENKSNTVSQTNKAPKLSLNSKPENADAQTYAEVVENVRKSVVDIYVYSESDTSSVGKSSGVVYSEDGYIVSNDHIFKGFTDPKILVRLYDGTEYEATFVAGDTRSDLSVMKISEKAENLVPAVFGNSDEILAGEEVLAIGFTSENTTDPTVTRGIVSTPKTRVTGTDNYFSTFIQTDAALNPGNSGGALCNLYGQVIGITSSKLAGDEYDSVSYAIPTTTMKDVVTELISEGTIKTRAKLGITYTEITSVLAKTQSLPTGAMIRSISDESDLDAKTFTEGDVITHVNGEKITTAGVLLDVIESSKAGDSIELTIYKAETKKSVTTTVKLAADTGTTYYNNKSYTSDTTDDDNILSPNPYADDDTENDDSDGDNNTFDFPLN